MIEVQRAFSAKCSPEERVLLAVLRSEPAGGAASDVVCEGVDWERLFKVAVRHQVAPLVFERLSAVPEFRSCIPASVAARFHHETMQNMAAKLSQTQKLEEVLRWLESLGVDVMLIKGTSLDRRVFDHDWLTVSGDVDLMVRGPLEALTEEARARVRALNAGRPIVDLHGTPHPDLVMNGVLPIDFDGVWDRALPVQVGTHSAFQMDVEDELLAACVQSCRKRFFRLKSLVEITELITKAVVDWRVLCDRAIAWECHQIVYTALFAAHAALGAAVPVDLRARLGVWRGRALGLRWLATRRSFCSFETLYDHVAVRGKFVGRSLLLPYASHTWRQRWRTAAVLWRQMRASGVRARAAR